MRFRVVPLDEARGRLRVRAVARMRSANAALTAVVVHRAGWGEALLRGTMRRAIQTKALPRALHAHCMHCLWRGPCQCVTFGTRHGCVRPTEYEAPCAPFPGNLWTHRNHCAHCIGHAGRCRCIRGCTRPTGVSCFPVIRAKCMECARADVRTVVVEFSCCGGAIPVCDACFTAQAFAWWHAFCEANSSLAVEGGEPNLLLAPRLMRRVPVPSTTYVPVIPAPIVQDSAYEPDHDLGPELPNPHPAPTAAAPGGASSSARAAGAAAAAAALLAAGHSVARLTRTTNAPGDAWERAKLHRSGGLYEARCGELCEMRAREWRAGRVSLDALSRVRMSNARDNYNANNDDTTGFGTGAGSLDDHRRVQTQTRERAPVMRRVTCGLARRASDRVLGMTRGFSSRDAPVAKGDRVVLDGLPRSHGLNGAAGVVIIPRAKPGRAGISLDGDKRVVFVKYDHLVPSPDAPVHTDRRHFPRVTSR